MSEKFITDVKSINILKDKMKDVPEFHPPATDLYKYRKFRKVKVNKNESISYKHIR